MVLCYDLFLKNFTNKIFFSEGDLCAETIKSSYFCLNLLLVKTHQNLAHSTPCIVQRKRKVEKDAWPQQGYRRHLASGSMEAQSSAWTSKNYLITMPDFVNSSSMGRRHQVKHTFYKLSVQSICSPGLATWGYKILDLVCFLVNCSQTR